MSRSSKVLLTLMSALLMTSLVCYTPIDVRAQGKKKKGAKDTKETKKEEKKEEKKEPFKPDAAQIEFKGNTDWIYGLAFTSDGKTLVSLARNRIVKIYDLNAKKEVLSLKASTRETQGLAVVKEQFYIGTGEFNKKKGAFEGEIRYWDIKTAKDIKNAKAMKGHSDFITWLSASKDGSSLASASKDQTVIIWNLGDHKAAQTIKGHTDAVNSVSFSPDGKQVVTTSADKTVRVWDVAGAKEVALFKVERMVESKDPKTKKVTQVKELGREFTRAVFTGDGKRIIACNLEGVIKIFDVADKKEVKELKAHEGIWSLAITPDGSNFATGGFDQTIKIWSTADAKDLRTIKAHVAPSSNTPGTVTALRFSPDGQWLASGGLDGMVKLWSVGK